MIVRRNRQHIAAMGLGFAAASLLAGCLPSAPQLGLVKNPTGAQCNDADCPTLEIPAPNRDDTHNAVALQDIDGSQVTMPVVWSGQGRVWWVMKLTPGTHKLSVASNEKLGGDFGSALAKGIGSIRTLEFEAQAGMRYWLWGSRRSEDASFDAWVEEGNLDRAFVVGTDGIEPNDFQKFLDAIGGGGGVGSDVYIYDARDWWPLAPQLDRLFQRSEIVGDTESFGTFPASLDAVPAALRAKAN